METQVHCQADPAQGANRIVPNGRLATNTQDFSAQVFQPAGGVQDLERARQRDGEGIHGEVAGGEIRRQVGRPQRREVEHPSPSRRVRPNHSARAALPVEIIVGGSQVVGHPPTHGGAVALNCEVQVTGVAP
jgi:hypothetical protein